MTQPHHDKIALVTGGSGGIGQAICERLGADGYTVVVNYRSNQGGAEDVCSRVRALGGNAWSIQADVLVDEQVRNLFGELRRRHDRLDVLVNNAGRSHQALFALTSASTFFGILEANLKGAVLCSQAALRLMLRQGSGTIINVSSRTAMQPQIGLTAYSAAKAALTNLTAGLARELAARGIRVNGVAPSWTDTEMLNKADADYVAKRVSQIAIGRVAKPEEVAAAVSALVRPDMTYMIGQTIILDGGGMK